MIVTVMRATFSKVEPKTVRYRDFSKYNSTDFGLDLDRRMRNQEINYDAFEKTFLETLEAHAPQKSKVIRTNHKPYVSNEMRKAIMLRSRLQNLLYTTPQNIGLHLNDKRITVIVSTSKREKNIILF